MKDSPPEPGEFDTTSVSQVSPLIFNYRKHTERVLIVAYMSLVPASPTFPLKKDGISNNFFYVEEAGKIDRNECVQQ